MAGTEFSTTRIGKAELPWIAKYRPSTLEEVIDHGEKISALKNLVSRNQLPHLLFYGPPDSGKTSLILALAREIYGEDIYIIVGHDHSNFIVGENIQARIKKTCEHHKKETNKIVERKLDISWRSNNEQSD